MGCSFKLFKKLMTNRESLQFEEVACSRNLLDLGKAQVLINARPRNQIKPPESIQLSGAFCIRTYPPPGHFRKHIGISRAEIPARFG